MSKTCYVNEQSFRMENKIIVQFELIIHSFFSFSFFHGFGFFVLFEKKIVNCINTYAAIYKKIK